MMRPVLLARNRAQADALQQLVDLHRPQLLDETQSQGQAQGGPAFVCADPEDAGELMAAYGTIASGLDEAVTEASQAGWFPDIVVLVDAIDPNHLNAIGQAGWDPLIAMLILAFPEVRWIFARSAHSADNDWVAIERRHGPDALRDQVAGDPLFDPTGLRDHVRKCTNAALVAIDDLKLPRRTSAAAVIDEERSYAWMHAYTAFRFGLRADSVVTWAAMQDRFGNTPAQSHGYWLLLEDMSLNFVDRAEDSSLHLLALDQRATHCPQLDSSDKAVETSAHRIMVTSGYSPEGQTLLANESYLKLHKGPSGRVLYKPLKGMFDLWRKAGLLADCTMCDVPVNRVPAFVWLPARRSTSAAPSGRHGTPGRLLRIAEGLVHRAERLAAQPPEFKTALRGAVLATEALELTGGRTPTTAIEALTLKHRFELLAECNFSGVQYHVDVKDRLREIRAQVDAIGHWFGSSNPNQARMNAEMTVAHALVGILRASCRFEEEQICADHTRTLQRKLWVSGDRPRLLFSWLLKYINYLLSSFPAFIGMVALWIFGLAFFFGLTGYDKFGSQPGHWYALSDAVSSFFSVGPPLSNSVVKPSCPGCYAAVSCIAIVSGFLHLGILISHLYALVARK